MSNEIAPTTPHEHQTLRLPKEKLESLQDWACNGTGRTAAARVRDSDGRIALIKNSWSEGWFVPGGAVEPNESPVDAAQREVYEETGLRATIDAPLVVLEQSYVTENESEEWFSAHFIVYSAFAEGEIPDVAQLGVSGEEIVAAQWFETLPADLHDSELLRPYLESN